MVGAKRVSLLVAISVVAAVAAYVVGIKAGNYVTHTKRERTRAASAHETEAILKRMATIQVGDTLPNYMVEDIDGNRFMLSQLLNGLTVISFISGDCDACLTELGATVERCRNSLDQQHFIYISTGNPVRLQALRKSYGIKSPILFDEAAYISNELKAYSYPLNLIVDNGRSIREIQSGALWPEQYESVLGFEEK